MLAGWLVLVATKVVPNTVLSCAHGSAPFPQPAFTGSEASLRQPAARDRIPLLVHNRSLARVEEHDRRAALVRPHPAPCAVYERAAEEEDQCPRLGRDWLHQAQLEAGLAALHLVARSFLRCRSSSAQSPATVLTSCTEYDDLCEPRIATFTNTLHGMRRHKKPWRRAGRGAFWGRY